LEINYSIDKPASVRIYIYEATGRIVTEVMEGFRAPGIYQRDLDLSHMGSGIYFVQLKCDTEFISAKKFIIVH